MALKSSTREWLLVLAALPVALVLWNIRGRAPRSGDVVDAPITLTTADRDQLGCAFDGQVGGHRCAFNGEGQPTGAPAPLAPYLTTARALFFIPGLFEQPALKEKLAQEPPEDRPVESLHRFVAQCRLRLLERVEGVKIRFATTAAFGPPESAWAAEVVDCQVE
jgi:hypothetical protein